MTGSMVKNCVIADGNITARDLHPNSIHPVEGGCETELYEDISHNVNVNVANNACSTSAADGRMKHCFKLLPTKVLGHFGSQEYRYTTIRIWVPDPASTGANEEVSSGDIDDVTVKSRSFFRRREQECEFVLRIADLDKHHLSAYGSSEKMSYYNLYSTMTLDMQMKKEVFFQYKEMKTFGNADLGIAILLRPFRRVFYGKVHEGGSDVDWTAYSNEWTRFANARVKNQKLRCANIFLRATSERLSITQVPHLTWLQIPQEAGGFFTGFILFFAVFVKTCLWSSTCSLCRLPRCPQAVRDSIDEAPVEKDIEPCEKTVSCPVSV
eukprot:TRINITY_DN8974_c0_g2_i3.p1 TRINITY_DN8974_c0_g2~~TRINITY_DN8974_c0_g2_i3.p1  ORF type:complete len:324 (+),score=30.16 TRINITY_DN8974_c0_g2_i3:104-1075(+)